MREVTDSPIDKIVIQVDRKVFEELNDEMFEDAMNSELRSAKRALYELREKFRKV
jgi:hypothetical protein